MTLSRYSEEFQQLAAGYVLEDLTPEEMERMECMLLLNPELRQELRIFQETMGMISFGTPPMQPPDRLRQKTLDAAATSVLRRQSSAAITNRPSMLWVKIVAAIAAAIAVLLGIDNFRLRQELSVAQSSNVEKVAALLQRNDSRLVALTGQENNSTGTLLFQKGKWQQVVLSLRDLPSLPAGEVYRLWLSLENNQTIFCGEFNTDTNGSVFVSINPPQVPPKGTKTTGIFVTQSPATAPLEPTGKRVAGGTI
ncbi:anti-sigma factor [Pseudanabaena sp. PCC 6802]|uniref:anti-sigma factor n=1 Tax=Pseudanabaena sp. PCC 6802 TaxID=118173 RepID=UPI000348EE94|nr:anti-sigma factor [Pseudanabaena sp. PCC 6802]